MGQKWPKLQIKKHWSKMAPKQKAKMAEAVQSSCNKMEKICGKCAGVGKICGEEILKKPRIALHMSKICEIYSKFAPFISPWEGWEGMCQCYSSSKVCPKAVALGARRKVTAQYIRRTARQMTANRCRYCTGAAVPSPSPNRQTKGTGRYGNETKRKGCFQPVLRQGNSPRFGLPCSVLGSHAV